MPINLVILLQINNLYENGAVNLSSDHTFRTDVDLTGPRATINGIMFVLVTGCRWGEMPKYDGVYALQRIRKANPKAKVIMITADLKKDAAQRLEDLKPDRIIFKPFDYGKIVDAIDDIRKIGFD